MRNILYVFFISMLPVVELRGSIPVGAGLGLEWYVCFIVAVIGNLVPVPFILLFIGKFLSWAKNCKIGFLKKFALWLERKAQKHTDTIDKYAAFGLFLLVAVPLPGTGAWTGSLIASILDLKPRRAVPAIICGVVAAGIIVALLSYGVKGVFGLIAS